MLVYFKHTLETTIRYSRASIMRSGGRLLNGHVDGLANLFSLEDGNFFFGEGAGCNSFMHEDIGSNLLNWERSSKNGIVNAMAKQIAQKTDVKGTEYVLVKYVGFVANPNLSAL